jgi:hypothetical protein
MDRPERILKKQQWRMDFATAQVGERELSALLKMTAEVKPTAAGQVQIVAPVVLAIPPRRLLSASIHPHLPAGLLAACNKRLALQGARAFPICSFRGMLDCVNCSLEFSP